MDKEKRNIPSIIYLQANPEDEYYKLEDGPFPDDEDVTWCRDKANDNDIPYIRAEAAQRAIWFLNQGQVDVAKGRLQACLDGAELLNDPYLHRLFLKDKLEEIEGGDYELVTDIIREIRGYFNL